MVLVSEVARDRSFCVRDIVLVRSMDVLSIPVSGVTGFLNCALPDLRERRRSTTKATTISTITAAAIDPAMGATKFVEFSPPGDFTSAGQITHAHNCWTYLLGVMGY